VISLIVIADESAKTNKATIIQRPKNPTADRKEVKDERRFSVDGTGKRAGI
jgi:hypothetical protein